jgi:energy-coupling factor transporter ATP-binding protein EcfA2
MTPEPGERALFVGMTGSGKSYLARRLLENRRYVLILDSKDEIHWPGYKRVTSLDAAMRLDPRREPRIILAPSQAHVSRETWDHIFKWAYETRNRTVYVDEVYDVIQDGVPDYYLAIATRGRSRKIGLWNAVQRPKLFPLAMISEANHVFAFQVQMAPDRQRIREVTSIPDAEIQALGEHEFLYYRTREGHSGPYRLTR